MIFCCLFYNFVSFNCLAFDFFYIRESFIGTCLQYIMITFITKTGYTRVAFLNSFFLISPSFILSPFPHFLGPFIFQNTSQQYMMITLLKETCCMHTTLHNPLYLFFFVNQSPFSSSTSHRSASGCQEFVRNTSPCPLSILLL